MPLPKQRKIELPLNEGTIKDLIISHLHNIGVIYDTEEVTDLQINKRTGKCWELLVSFGPDIQVIYHQ